MTHQRGIEIEPHLVITGAGISMMSGLPSGPALVEDALKNLLKGDYISGTNIKKISRSLPLEVFFQIVADHTSQDIATKVTTALDAENPSAVHNWLSRKVQEGLIKQIYTFNFDTLQEQSLGSILKRSTSGRSVVLTSEDLDFRLIKFHGSADSQGVISIGEYVQGFSEPVRKQFLDDWNGKSILVLGYGGWDADLAVTIDEAIDTGKLPRHVTWVDLSFPEQGGRTALLSEIESAGVTCKRLVGDLESVLSLDSKNKEESSLDPFDYRWEEFTTLDNLTTTAIMTEAAILADELEIASHFLEDLTGKTRLRLESILLERKGTEKVLEIYQKLIEDDILGTTQALAATRIYTLSQGQKDYFDSVNLNALHPSVAEHFSAYIKSRRTDLGGLDRPIAAARVRGLPKPHETAQGVENLDAVRLYVSLLTESARLLHEASDYKAALTLDKRAYRFTAALGDPKLKASVSGGIGVCLMGIADSLSGQDAIAVLSDAVHWLTKTIAPGRSQVGDYTWGLHMCNLGSALSLLGQPREGIKFIRKGLPVLQNSMPNWAVSAWAYLAGAYGDLYEKTRQVEYIHLGYIALAEGSELANNIGDFDDIYLIENEKQRLEALKSSASE